MQLATLRGNLFCTPSYRDRANAAPSALNSGQRCDEMRVIQLNQVYSSKIRLSQAAAVLLYGLRLRPVARAPHTAPIIYFSLSKWLRMCLMSPYSEPVQIIHLSPFPKYRVVLYVLSNLVFSETLSPPLILVQNPFSPSRGIRGRLVPLPPTRRGCKSKATSISTYVPPRKRRCI